MDYKISKEKLNYISSYLKKLIDLAENGVRKGRYNISLSALSAFCKIQYSINQVYTDKKAEDLLLHISKEVVKIPNDYCSDENTILFYDGFGLDLRGWAASFAKGLSGLEYDIVYVAPLHSAGNIPHIAREVENGRGKIEYIDMKHSYTSHIETLNNVFLKYRPQVAFFYTTPNDVAGAAVFDAYAGKTRRIQIDLTDHAFWIGTKAFDFITESRDVGVSNAIYHRGVDIKKVKKMDCCLYINTDVDSTSLPFNIEKEKYIFSGGSLYKTLGDEDLLFYKMIEHILFAHENVKFLYAGEGDDSELKKLLLRFPGRAFHIGERPDFYRLFKNSIFFLNTYPMFGGLMMRFSANAGKIPLTLKHGSDHEGILFNQESLGIEFDSFEEAMQEADMLIDDDQ